MPDKIQKWVCRTVRPLIAVSLELLSHHRNLASSYLFYRFYFGRCLSKLAGPVPLPHSRGRSTRYSNMLHDFSLFLDVIRMSMATVFLPRTVSFLYLIFDLWSRWLLSLELIDTFFLWVLSKQVSCMHSCKYMPRCDCLALHRVNPD